MHVCSDLTGDGSSSYEVDLMVILQQACKSNFFSPAPYFACFILSERFHREVRGHRLGLGVKNRFRVGTVFGEEEKIRLLLLLITGAKYLYLWYRWPVQSLKIGVPVPEN